jgi:dual specificity protein phosphatase-like protein
VSADQLIIFTDQGNIPLPLMTEVSPGLWVGGANGSELPPGILHLVSLVGLGGWTGPVQSILAVSMEDNDTQSLDGVDAIAAWVNSRKEPVLVHCGFGLNRSALIAARVLMLRGHDADEAIGLIREKRSKYCLCNAYFERWLRDDAPLRPRRGDSPRMAYRDQPPS